VTDQSNFTIAAGTVTAIAKLGGHRGRNLPAIALPYSLD